MPEKRRDTVSLTTALLAVVVGANCRRIRSEAGVTQNALARYARDVGLRWNTGKVGQFERGLYSPTLSTVIAVAAALSRATGDDVPLEALLMTPHDDLLVEVNDKLAVRGWRLAAFARGEPARWAELDDDESFMLLFAEIAPQLRQTSVEAVQYRSGLDEYRLAKRLHISAERLANESFRLWGRAFSDERDRRAGPDANAQKRGRTSRILQAELEKALTDGDD